MVSEEKLVDKVKRVKNDLEKKIEESERKSAEENLILFSGKNVYSNYNHYIINENGDDPKRIFTGYSAMWSPNGDKIYFSGGPSSNESNKIYYYDLKTDSVKEFFSVPLNVYKNDLVGILNNCLLMRLAEQREDGNGFIAILSKDKSMKILYKTNYSFSEIKGYSLDGKIIFEDIIHKDDKRWSGGRTLGWQYIIDCTDELNEIKELGESGYPHYQKHIISLKGDLAISNSKKKEISLLFADGRKKKIKILGKSKDIRITPMSFSPDGAYLIYGFGEHPDNITVVGLDHISIKKQKTLVNHHVWGPDSKKIVYVQYIGYSNINDGFIHILDIDTLNEKLIKIPRDIKLNRIVGYQPKPIKK